MKYEKPNIWLLIIFFALLFTRCMTSEKLAKQCAEKYPCTISNDTIVIVKDSTHSDTIRIAANTVFINDTVIVKCPKADTIIKVINTLPCKCPESQVIEKIRFVETERTITVRDSANVENARYETEKLNASIAKYKKWFQFSLGAAVVLFLLLCLTIYLLIRKK